VLRTFVADQVCAEAATVPFVCGARPAASASFGAATGDIELDPVAGVRVHATSTSSSGRQRPGLLGYGGGMKMGS
jgi:hypothetical protein